MKKVRFSLLSKALIALAFILLPIVVTFFVSYRSSRAYLEGYIFDDLSVIAEAYEGQIYQFLEMSKRRAQDFSSDGFVREELKRMLSGKGRSGDALSRHLIKNKIVLDRAISKILVISPGGRVAASTDADAVGADVSREPFFIKGAVKPSASEVPLSNGEREMAFSAPIMDRGADRVIGVITNVLRFSELNRLLAGEFTKEHGAITWRRGRRKTMEVYLVNFQKLMMTESIFVHNAPFRQVVDTEPVRECLASSMEMVKRYRDYRGVEVAGASNCFPGLKWTLLVEVDAEDVFAGVRGILKDAFMAGGFIAGVIGVFFILFLRKILRPLLLMADAAREISAGNYDTRVPVVTADEIGILASSFNSMARDIKANTALLEEGAGMLKEAQRIGRMGSGVWDIAHDRLAWSDEALRILGVPPAEFKGTMDAYTELIHPEDRRAFRDAVEAAMRAEHDDFSVEHRVVRPDGRIIWVHSLGSIEFDASGAPARGCGTIQDITERKHAEEDIRNAETKYRTLIEQIPAITYIASADDSASAVYVSPQVERLGYTLEDWKRDPLLWPKILHPDDKDRVLAQYAKVFEAPEKVSLEYRIVLRDGSARWFRDDAALIRDVKGAPLFIQGVMLDIAERKQREEDERLKNERLAGQQSSLIRLVTRTSTIEEGVGDSLKFITETVAGTLDAGRASVWLFSPNGKELRCVDLFEKTPGRHSSGAVLKTESFPEYSSALEAGRAIDASDAGSDPRTRELKDAYLAPAGIASLLCAPMRVAGKLTGVACAEHAATMRRWAPDEAAFVTGVADHVAQVFIEAERRKAGEEIKKLSMVIENSVNVVYITDLDGTIEYINPMFEAVTGYGRDEAVGMNASMLSSADTAEARREEMRRTLLDGKAWHGVLKNRKKDGAFYWSSTVMTPIKNDVGSVTRFLSVQEDVTDRRIAEEKMHRLAAYDSTTGLYNREWFIKELGGRLPAALDSGQKCALLFIDIDRFQFFNDTYGHVVGDDMLRNVARLLEDIAAVKGAGIEIILGRLGSDEFALFMIDAGARQALTLANAIKARLEGERPAAEAAHITVSVGLALIPEHGAAVKELFSKADAAMFRAKGLGGNRCHLYSPEDKDLEDMHLRLTDKERIINALEKGLFLPWYQPILDLKSGEVKHYEALARLRTPAGDVLGPAQFIDTAERFGLIGSIDRIIIEKVMRRQAGLMRRGKRYAFSMNLSGNEIGESGLLGFLINAASMSGADPECLIFEITETAAIKDFEKAVKFINGLKAKGFRFSLDDFGVGFASFHYLKEMKVDYIKIDGSFIKKLDENPHDQLFVKAIISVARGMGIKTIAEFVEREEVLRLLKEYGADFGQGYLIGKPAPAGEV